MIDPIFMAALKRPDLVFQQVSSYVELVKAGRSEGVAGASHAPLLSQEHWSQARW